jgi:hypothetical protein
VRADRPRLDSEEVPGFTASFRTIQVCPKDLPPLLGRLSMRLDDRKVRRLMVVTAGREEDPCPILGAAISSRGSAARRSRGRSRRARSSRVKYLGFRPRRSPRRRLKNANRPSRIRLVLRCAFNSLCSDVLRASRAVCPFLSRLALGKIAELEQPRRYPTASGTRPNLLSGTRSSVSCSRSDACRKGGFNV